MATRLASDPEESPDRIVVRLDPGGPIELAGLADSFAALARIYARHYRPHEDAEAAPKLFISKLENGSVIAEIVPYVMLLGMAVHYMDAAMIVSDFTRRVSRAIKAFSGEDAPTSSEPLPSSEDARDIREFVRPLAGRKGAELGISHARYEKTDGKKKTVVEYKFDETEINRAALAIDSTLSQPSITAMEYRPHLEATPTIRREVMLFFQQASRLPGKEEGRTGDRAVVPEVSDKALPVYFRKGAEDLKDRMVRGEENPLTNAFVVDVHVQYVGREPKGYIVTDVHRVISSEET